MFPDYFADNVWAERCLDLPKLIYLSWNGSVFHWDLMKSKTLEVLHFNGLPGEILGSQAPQNKNESLKVATLTGRSSLLNSASSHPVNFQSLMSRLPSFRNLVLDMQDTTDDDDDGEKGDIEIEPKSPGLVTMETPGSFSVLFSSLKSISTSLVTLAILTCEVVPEWLPNVSACEGLAHFVSLNYP